MRIMSIAARCPRHRWTRLFCDKMVVFDPRSQSDSRILQRMDSAAYSVPRIKLNFFQPAAKNDFGVCPRCGLPFKQEGHKTYMVFDRCLLCGEKNPKFSEIKALAEEEKKSFDCLQKQKVASYYDDFRNYIRLRYDPSALDFVPVFDCSRPGTSSAGDVVFNAPVTSTNRLILDWEDIP